MAGDRVTHTLLGLCAVILTVAALFLARAIVAPTAFALFTIALVWPLQSALQARLPQLLALALTLLVIVGVVTVLTSSIFWGFSHVAQWLLANAARIQALYGQTVDWLEEHGIYVAAAIAESFNVAWLLGLLRQVTATLQNMLSFSLVTLVFVLLGLLEVDLARRKLAALGEAGPPLLRASAEIAVKLRRYMWVRTLMSLMTGLLVWGFALLAGLELAAAWGVIAFALNYVPFIGPAVATVFPTLFAIAQFESWQMAVTVFLCLNLIQFLIGSYLEPRIAGAALSLSPFMVLFAVFFWAFLWGLPGAFIGVPIMIALHTLCEHYPAGRWFATVLSGRPEVRAGAE